MSRLRWVTVRSSTIRKKSCWTSDCGAPVRAEFMTAFLSRRIFSCWDVRSMMRVAVTTASMKSSFSARFSGLSPSTVSLSRAISSASAWSHAARRCSSLWFNAFDSASATMPPTNGITFAPASSPVLVCSTQGWSCGYSSAIPASSHVGARRGTFAGWSEPGSPEISSTTTNTGQIETGSISHGIAMPDQRPNLKPQTGHSQSDHPRT